LCETVISELRKVRQEDPKFENTLYNTSKGLPQKKKRKKERKERKEGKKDKGREGGT
jgi:hypothetical protein